MLTKIKKSSTCLVSVIYVCNAHLSGLDHAGTPGFLICHISLPLRPETENDKCHSYNMYSTA
jgi:hypothetical protein